MASSEKHRTRRRSVGALLLVVVLLVTSTASAAGSTASIDDGLPQSDVEMYSPALDTSTVLQVDCDVFNAELSRLQQANRLAIEEYIRVSEELDAAEPPHDPDIPPFDLIRMLEEIRKPYLDRLTALRDQMVDRVLRIQALSGVNEACQAGTLSDPDAREAAVQALESGVEDLDTQIADWERRIDYGNLQQCVYQSGRQTDMGLSCPPQSWHADGSDAETWIQVSERRTDEGMYAITYENADRSVRVVVYEGSVPFRDVFNKRWWKHWIVDNLWGGLTGHSDQTTQAMTYSIDATNDLAPGQELVTVGHSRGCKHASAGAIATGTTAVCFDGAGLPANTVPKYLRDRGYSEHEIRVLRAQADVIGISADTDLLTRAQELLPFMPDVPGGVTKLETPPDTTLGGHSMDLVLELEKEQASELDDYRSRLQSAIDELTAED